MRFHWLVLLALLSALSCSKADSDSDAAQPAIVVPDQPAAPKPDQPLSVVEGQEGQKFYTGLIHKPDELKGLGEVHMTFNDCDNLPESFDLRPLGLVPPIRDQGSCGSCWAFSMTASLESAMLGIGKTLNLSEQQQVSCDTAQWGCNGGLLNDFKFQINKGQALESDFPYVARDVACKQNLPVAAKGVSFTYIGAANRAPTEKELKCALVKSKTIPWVTVGATNGWGSPPSSENTMYNRCGAAQTNHAIGTVGYKSIGGKLGFIARNSWGTGWGSAGYMVLPLLCNNFAEEAAFISVEQPPGPTPTPGPGPSPTPEPCTPPKIKLPALVVASPNVEVMLGVKPQAGWQFEWYADGVAMPGENGSMLYVTPAKDTVYKLVAKSSCGTAESSVKVSLLMARNDFLKNLGK